MKSYLPDVCTVEYFGFVISAYAVVHGCRFYFKWKNMINSMHVNTVPVLVFFCFMLSWCFPFSCLFNTETFLGEVNNLGWKCNLKCVWWAACQCLSMAACRQVPAHEAACLTAQVGSIPSPLLPSQAQSWYVLFSHVHCSAWKPAEPAVCVQRRTCARASVFVVPFVFPVFEDRELRIGSIALASL